MILSNIETIYIFFSKISNINKKLL